jgi:hypothetical protein
MGNRPSHAVNLRHENMSEQIRPATTEEKIAYHARHIWRPADKEAIADKGNPEKQRAEYWARQQLRKVCDEAGEP